MHPSQAQKIDFSVKLEYNISCLVYTLGISTCSVETKNTDSTPIGNQVAHGTSSSTIITVEPALRIARQKHPIHHFELAKHAGEQRI
uniref:AlNc14C28G2669 protein n=1 Tax=Albugo laibachii Nc14 TaxID=890382 RepID=F0W740_9STRA|nr:AlNc14C28G2669 [Albugo laibachii Nc14]|eukprot:CCA16939.1 AlNc14C28G2669 [Albugo laibachii Nc14]